jgi:anaphase-promoting complex subunit 6
LTVADPNDAFWLAQTHFLTGHYLRAERILTQPLPRPSTKLPKRASTGIYNEEMNGLDKGKGKGKTRAVEDNEDDEDEGGLRGKLVDESLACRYLAAQCLVSFTALKMCIKLKIK